ncbi:MAG: SLC13 family permease, partial [Pseudomonadota bacterium]
MLENYEPIFGLVLLVATFIAFAKEVFPPSGIAVIAASVLLATGILSLEDVAGVLATPALLTIAAMF